MAQICDPSKSMYDPPNEESNRFNRVDLWTNMGGGMASLPANGVLSQTQCILHIQLPGGTQLSNQSFTEGQERSFEEAGTTYYLTATTIYPSATLNLVKVTSCYDAPDQQKQATLTGQIITPTPHSIGQTISFKGKLTYNGQAIPGKRLDLIKLTNNASVSNAITNSSGEATLTYTVDQWDPKDIPFLIGAYYLAPDYFTIETNQLNITLADSEKPTTLTITPSPPADETGYREGDIITLTVTLKDQDGSPLPNTTPVKYYKGSTYIGQSFLSYGQTQAQYIVKATDKDLSPITLTAKFEGMERYLPSQQSTAPLTISPANGAIQPTSLTLAAAPVKEIYNWNDNITLSAQLSTSSNPQPPDQSQVKFYNDTTLIGTGPNLIMGVTFIEYTVQPTPTQIQAGTMTLKATFAGIEGYSASEKTLTIKISPEIAPPQKEDVQFTLTLKPEKETYLHGESIEITATLLDKTSTPINGAEVDFYINGAFLKEVYTSLGGYAVATYLVQTNQITTKEIKTSYYGDTLHNAKDLTKTINVTNIPPSYDITVNAINVPAGGAPVRLHKITKLGQNPFTSENLYLLDWTVFKKTATSPSDSVIFSSKEWVNLKQYDGYTFAIYMGDPTSGIITESQAQIITLKDKSTHNLSSLIVPGDIAGPMCKLFGISTTDCPNFTTTLATDLLVPYSDLSIIINGIDPFTGQPRQATWWNYAFTALYLLPFAKLGTTAISKGGLLLSKYIDEAPTLKYFLESDSAIFHLIGGTSDNLDKATELAKTGKFEELKQFLDNLGPASADAIETFKTELRKIDGMTEDLIQRILYHSKILQTPLEQLKNFADLLVSNGAFYEGQLDIVRALIKSNPEDARIAFGTIDEPTWKILQSDLLTLQDGYITRAYILEMLHTIKPLDPTIISDKIATLLTDLSKVNRTPIDSRGEVWLIRYAINTFPDHLSARLKYIDPDDWTQIISVLDQNGMSDLANLLKPLRILDNFDLISLLDGIIKLNAPVTMDGHKFIKQIARVEPNRFVSALGKYTDDELLLTIERLLEGGATEIPGIQLGHFLRQTSKFKQILLESPELTNLVPDIAAAMESIGNDIPTLELVDIVSDQIIKVTNAAQELRPLAPSKATTFKKFFTELRINPKNIKLTIINSLDDIRIAWNQADTLTRLKYIRNVISTTGTLAFLFWLVYDPISLYVFATWLYETARGTAPGNVTKNGDRYVSRISTLYYETNNACRDNNIDYLKTQLPIYKESIDELIQFIESNESNLIEEQSLNQANKAVETYSNHYNEMLNCAGLATIDLPIPADGILKNVHITKITDGDSFDATWDPGNLSEGQEPYIITGRMIGINAPEYSGDDYRLNCSSTPIGIVPLVANKDIYDKASINLISEPETNEKIARVRGQRNGLLDQRFSLQKDLSRIEARLELVSNSADVKEVNLIAAINEIKNIAESSLAEENVNKLKAVVKSIILVINNLWQRKSSPINELDENKKHLIEKLESVQKGLEDLELKETEFTDIIKDFNEKFREAFITFEEERNNLIKLKEERNNAFFERERVEIRIKDLSDQIVEIGRRIEEFSSRGGSASGGEKWSVEPLADEETMIKRMFRLRGEISAIGEIDPNIIKEYKETEKRYTFLTDQVEDLEHAMTDLKNLIKELEYKIHHEFTSAVGRINEEFTRYIHLLFGGGRAKLVVDENTVKEEGEEINNKENNNEELETGVYIDISLPRKRVKGLEVLSGGERALVSIAALFALISVSPPPFLVLDEIDAALDERNARRFSELLKEFAKKTQFIIVTHNRATMEAADVLYGVTMSPDGTSKILSLKLS